jgi:hypothetical protein
MTNLISPENVGSKLSLQEKIFRKLFPGWERALREKRRIGANRANYSPITFERDWGETNFNRASIVNLMISQLSKNKEVAYLEIGCARNALFDSIACLNKVGVDPMAGGTHRMTSDEYFLACDQTFDIIFIDGLHEYTQVARDFRNAFNHLSEGGYILFHDMLPRNWIEANIPILLEGPWVGDVWKLAFDLSAQYLDEFVISEIDYGVGIYRKNSSENLLETNFANKTYHYYAEHREELPIKNIRDTFEWIWET